MMELPCRRLGPVRTRWLLVLVAFVAAASPSLAAPAPHYARTWALFRALRNRDEHNALALLPGLDPRLTDARGRTPLHYAAHRGFPQAVRRLVRAGAKVNAADG